MAERRMFAKSIIDTDAFLELPLSTQALYFHLSMRADDEGFVSKPKSVQRLVRASDDDFKLLVAKRYILMFDTGVIVIKHWKIHNYIRADRIQKTNYTDEKDKLTLQSNGAYTEADGDKTIPIFAKKYTCPSDVSQMSVTCPSNVSIGKDSIGKDSINNIYIVEQEEKKDTFSDDCRVIIDYLNKKTGKGFKATTNKTKICIHARLEEGFTVDDFKTVIDIKCQKWLKDDKMRDYLRPETLFGTKFEGYLNEAPQKKPVIPAPVEEQPQEEVLDIRTGYELLPQNEWTEDEIEDAVSKGIISEEEAHSILWG